jgi:membrane-bound ClpP family serine protease
LIILSVLFFLFLIYFYISSHFSRIDSIPIGIESIIIISFAFYFFYEKIKNPSVSFIYNDYRFWILIGMIIYLAGSFFIYIYGEQLDEAAWRKFRYLTYVFYILRALFFLIAILIFVKSPKEKPKLSNKHIPFLDIS